MRVEGLVYASEALMDTIRKDKAIDQVANVAHLPGIVGKSIAMPDIHWGYGFPIGGVAAFDPREGGVVSPGGVGYDIGCGVRLLRSDIAIDDVRSRLPDLASALFAAVPCGVGSSHERIAADELDRVLEDGAAAAVSLGWGTGADLEHLEAGGCLPDADPRAVTPKARERGLPQLGTLGSGNHFMEVGWIAEIHDEAAAEAFGLRLGQLTVFIHTGSRGLGHQVCDDHVRSFQKVAKEHRIGLPDRQLACAPIHTAEASRYLAAMNAAANFAFANRQRITHSIRKAFGEVLGQGRARSLKVVYDVAHNVAKWEEHRVGGVGASRRLLVHRKGATRAFPAGHPEVPAAYRDVGQPVLIPGDMGRYSYVLVGQPGAMDESFGSSCHGAGRVMSRSAAKKLAHAGQVKEEMKGRGILIRAASNETIVEEISEAYKDVAEVVAVTEQAGLTKIVAQHRPALVVKG